MVSPSNRTQPLGRTSPSVTTRAEWISVRRIRDDDLYAVIGERDELCRVVALPVMNVSDPEGLGNEVTVRGQRDVAHLCGLLGAAWQTAPLGT